MNECSKRSGQYFFCIQPGFKQIYKALPILMNRTMSKVAFYVFGIISQTYFYHLVELVIVLVCNTAIPGITSHKGGHNKKVKLSGKV